MNKRMKNIAAHIVPPASWVNTDGRTTNINPGPSAGFAPRAKTVVKIAIPANKAIKVSMTIIHRQN